MQEFDPFDPNADLILGGADAVTADRYGLAILDKMEEGERVLGKEFYDAHPEKSKRKTLESNLAAYASYKRSRKEKLFDNEKEARALNEAKGAEDLARYAVNVFSAEGSDFQALLKKNGDQEQYNMAADRVRDPARLAKKYKLDNLLLNSGYTQEMVEAGVAEPHMRRQLNAAKDQPTINAYSDWGHELITRVDRRRDVAKAATIGAENQFLGMMGDFESLEESMGFANFTPEERTHIRAIWNKVNRDMEKDYKDIKPIVRRVFNTIAAEENIPSRFEGQQDQPYEDMDAAIDALTKIPLKDFDKVSAMMAMVAEKHGQNPDRFFTNLGKQFSRGFKNLDTRAGMNAAKGEIKWGRKILKQLEDEGKDIWVSKDLPESGETLVKKLKHYSRSDTSDMDAFSKWLWGLVGQDISQRKVTPKEYKEAKEIYLKQERAATYTSMLVDWRSRVADISHKNDFVDTVIYGTAHSLPEMGAAALGPGGFALVASAQTERNMAEIQRRNPRDYKNWENHRDAAATGGLLYSAANLLQLRTATKGLTATENVLKRIGKVAGFESVTEVGQDLSFPAVLEVYSAMNNDIQDFDMLPKKWANVDFSKGVEWMKGDLAADVHPDDGELIKNLKMYPKTMLAMLPIAAAGVGGQKASLYFNDRAFEQAFKNRDLMDMYGVDPYNQKVIQDLPLEDALNHIQANNSEFTANMSELEAPRGVSSSVQTHAAQDGSFTVTNGDATVVAHSVEEAAEAALQLDPTLAETPRRGTRLEVDERVSELNQKKRTQREQTEFESLREIQDSNYKISTPADLSEARFSVNSQTSLESRQDLETWGKTLSPMIDVSSPIGHPDVTRGLLKALDALKVMSGIRYAGGKKLPKNVLGTYNFREGLLRVAQHGNITTAAHEMAHAIQDQFLYPGKPLSDANWWDDKSFPDAAKNDLAKIAATYYAGGTMGKQLADQGIILSEGFAEYIRLRMQGDTSYSAPAFDAWFDKNILDANPKFKKHFLATSQLMKDYDLQGSLNRMRGNVAPPQTIKDKAEAAAYEAKESAITKMVESFNPLKKIVKSVERMTGKALPDSLNPYLIAKRRRYTHSAIAARMVENGMVDFVGRNKGFKTSLKYALRDIRAEERTDFTIYMWARRALSLHRKGKNPGVSFKDAEMAFKELHNPRFERAAGLVYDWNDAVLQYVADSSSDYAEVVRNIRDWDVGDYIPLAREFESFQKKYNSFSGSATGVNIVKHLKGSGRRIKDPFISLVSNAEKLVLRAHERTIIETLFKLLKLKDSSGQFIKMGPIITKVPPRKIPEAYRNAADLSSEIARVLDGELSEMASELGEAIKDSDQADAMVTLWGQAYNPPNKLENPIIPIFINGKREFYEVDRNAYEALGGLDVYRPQNLAMSVSSATTKTWRAGTTGLNATFQMVTNPTRDVRTLYQQTRSKAGFFRIMGTWGNSMARGVLEGLSAKHLQSEWSILYDNLGLEMVTPLGQDANYTRKAVRNLFTTSGAMKVVRTIDPRNIGAYLRDGIQFAEKATRLTEIKLLARDIGFDPQKDELTPEIAQKLALAAREVTTDFSASGSVGKMLNQVLPFWNSHVQGVRAHLRAAYKSAKDVEGRGKVHQFVSNQFMARGLMMSGISVALWFRNRDEEWWKEMPQDEKYNHSFIHVSAEINPFSDEDELLKIPKAFELDGFFMGLPVAALDSFYEENPKEAVDWAKRFLESSVPNHPVILNYMLESEGKEDFFGRPVIPQREEVLDVDGERYRQYGPQTTKVAMKLGKMFDMSPRRLDHVVKSFFGRAGIDALEVFGTAESDIREPHLTRFPVLGALFHPKGQNPYSPKSVTAFYDLKQELSAKASKINREVEETDDQRLTRLMINDASDALTMLREVRKITTDEADIRKLTRLEASIAREAVKSYNEKTIDREKFHRMEIELEEQLKD